MPKITDINTVNEIARYYVSNGKCKVKALISAGYTESYASAGTGLKLYDNVRVKEAISALEAEAAAIAGYTIDQCQQEYESARLRAITLKQPSAEISAITGKARLYGMDKDNSAAIKEGADLTKYSPEELERIKWAAKAITKGTA